MIRITRKKGRLRLELRAYLLGGDFCVLITGGAAHLGAVTAASGAAAPVTAAFGAHRENLVTELAAGILGAEFDRNFAVCCGIHYDDIEKREIAEVMELSGLMITELCKRLRAQFAQSENTLN